MVSSALSSLRCDAHACLPLHPEASLSPLHQYRQAGVHFVSINVGMDLNPVDQIMATIAGFRYQIKNDPHLVLVHTTADIQHAANRNQLAVAFDLEGGLPLLKSPHLVEVYRTLGVQQIHLAYNRSNPIAGGCHDRDTGLTVLGHQIVKEINRNGILMDCSHTGYTSSLDIMEASQTPVIFSHANPNEFVKHQRNITLEQIQRCAQRGGIICVNGVSLFLGNPSPTAQDLLPVIRYLAEHVGVDAIGVGLDIGFSQPSIDDTPPPPFNPEWWWPVSAGYQSGLAQTRYTPVDTWAHLPHLLDADGFSQREIDQILGGNYLRVKLECEAFESLHT